LIPRLKLTQQLCQHLQPGAIFNIYVKVRTFDYGNHVHIEPKATLFIYSITKKHKQPAFIETIPVSM